MTNYENLKKAEEEKQKYEKEIGADAFMDAESDFDFHVERISTGQKGYVETYLDSTDVCFIVPKEDLTEYRITQEEFDNDFIKQNL